MIEFENELLLRGFTHVIALNYSHIHSVTSGMTKQWSARQDLNCVLLRSLAKRQPIFSSGLTQSKFVSIYNCRQRCFGFLGLISADARMEEKPNGHLKRSHTCGIVYAMPKCSNSISFPGLRSPWPAVGKLWEHPFWNNKGNNRILHIRFHCAVRSLHLWYLWRMPEMDAPRALVFWPLVKGNEALGTRLVPHQI